jgi:hypothetical protein
MCASVIALQTNDTDILVYYALAFPPAFASSTSSDTSGTFGTSNTNRTQLRTWTIGLAIDTASGRSRLIIVRSPEDYPSLGSLLQRELNSHMLPKTPRDEFFSTVIMTMVTFALSCYRDWGMFVDHCEQLSDKLVHLL